MSRNMLIYYVTFKQYVDLLLIEEKNKDFSCFMYDHTLHSRKKKHEILISHINDCFKIDDK